MDETKTTKECSIKTVIHIGIGTVTFESEGCDNIQMLYEIKDSIVEGLDMTKLDIQKVETTITEIEE